MFVLRWYLFKARGESCLFVSFLDKSFEKKTTSTGIAMTEQDMIKVVGQDHKEVMEEHTGKTIGSIKAASSPVNLLFGTLLLWVGWYGFNPGSTTSLLEDQDLVAAKVAVNTTLCAVGGGFVPFFLNVVYFNDEADDIVLTVCIGILGGLVASCAGCHLYTELGAFVVGVISYIFTAKFNRYS